MAGLQFDGAIDNITEKQFDFIKSVLENHGFYDNTVVIEPVGKAGDNYQASVKRIVVQKENETFKMIAKIAPAVSAERDKIQKAFFNETVVYTKLFPAFLQIENAAGVPDEEKLKYAECYEILEEESNEIILLEDLTELGYTMVDRLQPLNDGQVKSIMKNFAKYHALSFALKNKDPEVFEDIRTSLYDMWAEENMENKSFFEMFLNQVESNVLMVLEKEEHKRLVKGTITRALEIINEITEADKDAKEIVIQQGDAWTNNILYKDNGTPIPSSIMIDYQQVRPANPVWDLHFMIFNCTDYQSRKDHLNEWIDFYYNEFDNALSNLGLDANIIYPRDKLDLDLKRYSKIGLIQSLLLALVMIIKPEEAEKMKEAYQSADVNELGKMNNIATILGEETLTRFKTKVEGIVASLLEFDMI